MVKFVNFKARLIAHLIDLIIISLASFMLFFIIKLLPINSFTTSIYELKELITLVISMSYYVILTASEKHATLGKQFLGIIVVDRNMKGLSLSHSLGRYLAYYFSYITLCIGFLMIPFTKKHTALHDKIAGTYVVKKHA